MSRPKSVYLTSRSMSALRSGDALSGRMNQIVDRYLQMVTMESHLVRGQFSDDEWAKMVAAVPSAITRDLSAVAEVSVLIRNLRGDRALAARAVEFSAGNFFTLIELLEADRAKVGDPIPANS